MVGEVQREGAQGLAGRLHCTCPGRLACWEHGKMLKVPNCGQRLRSLEGDGAGAGQKGRKKKLASLQATTRESVISPVPIWTTGEEPEKASLEAVDQGLSIAP